MIEMKFQSARGSEILLRKNDDGLNPEASIPGRMDFVPASWASVQDRDTRGKVIPGKRVFGVVAREVMIGGKTTDVCCLPHYRVATNVKAFFDEAEAAEKAEEKRKAGEKRAQEEAEIEAVRSGRVPIELHYHDGEYLSGHMVFGPGAKLLKEIGQARDVDGWGTYVPCDRIGGKSIVEALGKTFTFPAAKVFARPALEAKAEKVQAAKEALEAKFAQAKATGEPVLISQWSEECSDPKEECDIDHCVKYAMPDGTTKVARSHTY